MFKKFLLAFAAHHNNKLTLSLKETTKIADNTYGFWFASDRRLDFKPGQYLEWTLDHKQPDNRGKRRFFTIASSPTETGIRLGTKFNPNSSTFKQALAKMKPGDQIIASQLAGNFTLPPDPGQKLVLIAGGIGITPFRSMIKYLIDTKEKRDIVLMYSNNKIEDIAYKEVLDQAQKQLNIKTIYVLTDLTAIPTNWQGEQGFIAAQMITKNIPDYQDRLFYISGPHSMVVGAVEALKLLKIPSDRIKTDFFPGFA